MIGSPTTKTGRLDIVEMLLKVELNTIKSTQIYTAIRQSKLKDILKES
jgi:site-specific recombinase XerD